MCHLLCKVIYILLNPHVQFSRKYHGHCHLLGEGGVTCLTEGNGSKCKHEDVNLSLTPEQENFEEASRECENHLGTESFPGLWRFDSTHSQKSPGTLFFFLKSPICPCPRIMELEILEWEARPQASVLCSQGSGLPSRALGGAQEPVLFYIYPPRGRRWGKWGETG